MMFGTFSSFLRCSHEIRKFNSHACFAWLKRNSFCSSTALNKKAKNGKDQRIRTGKGKDAMPKKLPPLALYYRESYQLFGPVQSESSNIKKHNDSSDVLSQTSQGYETEFRMLNGVLANNDVILPRLPKVRHPQATIDNDLSTAKSIDEGESHPMLNQSRVIGQEMPSLLQIFRKRKSSVNAYCPSVSAILNETMPQSSRLALERWKKKMIDKLGDEGFRIYKQG